MAGIEDEGQDVRRRLVDREGGGKSEDVWLDRYGRDHRLVDTPAVVKARQVRTVRRDRPPVHSVPAKGAVAKGSRGGRCGLHPNTLFTIASLYGINNATRRLGSGR
ncbi:hypothetical protein GCM10007890_30740 [Methylobacterium tardum]|uniref:Uncharacterized protein n=1 Tax=Methylobacterium tardum TaxID=374432 RepID=A0AA37TCA6_9HYPH|nr:hypothetical protein GCM10007890_30740 [Methylobacterium tardum]